MESRLVPTPRSLADVELQSRDTIGQGWGKIERFVFRHRRHDGEWSEEVTRDVYTIGEAVNVLPYDPTLDAVLLIEQFRACGLAWGEATWLFEVVAGMRGEEETPEEVARREAIEEAECRLTALHPVSTVWSSPGGYGERTYLFVGIASLEGVGGIHGLAHEHEDIRAVVVPLAEAHAATQDGRIRDAKTTLLIQWLMLNKSQLA
ncbi:NUDIX domain-containing protein [Parvibaculum sp.]|jgi:ADP-ribose pyrophosphatase|uniref:NUDIX domain-containing protein n=1 Tax=Parvibaculum sp. TaxID=2024848 RepID=UPI000C5F898D|nr:NUDIX domain-containing protein [Parvibaculum sp.]HAC58067.1 ADP-ribose diphosphatase [Rhodobiaceae bacterium]MAU60419.1 ADP-ribose diphosphatase [Parvibaculum sp.]MBO6669212.1 NUDIX domain-containing protein [Parvibaculum sp.]MBO6693208.1 NUDIX domain-containing protein [Parvibaculum sp.]MBO6713022.1 NUDIX domain-containing protein [Parvibaculum sp.]|tara:strand:+ start:1928 stop:2542 length:615 start_codon:yes stop_codon:yes gene_type:complete